MIALGTWPHEHRVHITNGERGQAGKAVYITLARLTMHASRSFVPSACAPLSSCHRPGHMRYTFTPSERFSTSRSVSQSIHVCNSQRESATRHYHLPTRPSNKVPGVHALCTTSLTIVPHTMHHPGPVTRLSLFTRPQYDCHDGGCRPPFEAATSSGLRHMVELALYTRIARPTQLPSYGLSNFTCEKGSTSLTSRDRKALRLQPPTTNAGLPIKRTYHRKRNVMRHFCWLSVQ